MKSDERHLLQELKRRRDGGDASTPAELAALIGMHPKRCLSLCQGWWGKRWLDQSTDPRRGANFTTGRLTEAGMQAAAECD